MSFHIHTIDTAPDGSKVALAAIEERYGFIPNLAGVFAESSGALKGLLSAIQSFDDEVLTLTPLERQVLLVAVSVHNRCDYCTAAHSMLATSMGLSREELDRLQRQQPLEDEKLEALRSFATHLVEKRGWVDDSTLDRFLGTGYTRAQVFEVVLGVSLKTLTNYANHIARPAVNAQFSAFLPDRDRAA